MNKQRRAEITKAINMIVEGKLLLESLSGLSEDMKEAISDLDGATNMLVYIVDNSPTTKEG